MPGSEALLELFAAYWDNYREEAHFTILHNHLFAKGAHDLEKLLQDHDYMLDGRDSCGRTALWWAIELGNYEAVEVLLKYGADASIVDADLSTPLTIALRENNVSVTRLLLDNAARNKVSIHYKNRLGLEALHDVCSWSRHPAQILSLLKHGASVDARDTYRATPLHYAAREDIGPFVHILLNSGASIDALDEDGDTPLMWAVNYDSYSAIRILLRRGCYPEITYSWAPSSLHYVAVFKDLRLVKLLKKAAKIHDLKLDVRNEEGFTARDIVDLIPDQSCAFVQAFHALGKKILRAKRAVEDRLFDEETKVGNPFVETMELLQHEGLYRRPYLGFVMSVVYAVYLAVLLAVVF